MELLVDLLIGFGFALVIFLVFRRIVWWYFGIDKAISHLESIDRSLQQLPVVREARIKQAQRRKSSA